MSVNSKMTAIANKIRTLLGRSDRMGLDAMATHLGTAQAEVDDQADLIAQISEALDNKESGVSPTGSLSITQNGTHDVYNYARAVVNVANTATLQEKTVEPSTIQQTVTPDSGYQGLSEVTVSAMPTATQATPSITVSKTGLITASATQTAGYVTAGTKSGTKQLTVQAAQTITPGTSNQTIASGRYLTGTQTIKGDSNLVAANIAAGVSIFGVTGTHESGSNPVGSKTITANGTYDVTSYASAVVNVAPVLQEKTVTPSTSQQTVTPGSGYQGLSKVTVSAMPTATQATPSITVSKTGLITVSATQTAGYVSEGTKSATKQLTVQAAQTITPGTSDQTIIYDRYLIGNQTIKGDSNLVAANIAKGVSIFGVTGTHEGGITPTGSKTITANGTYDVTSYASAVVNVPKEQRKTGTCTGGANGAVTVDVGFQPDIVMFTGHTFASGNYTYETGPTAWFREMADGAIYKCSNFRWGSHSYDVQLRRTTTGFEIISLQVYTQDGWKASPGCKLNYIAVKYPE